MERKLTLKRHENARIVTSAAAPDKNSLPFETYRAFLHATLHACYREEGGLRTAGQQGVDRPPGWPRSASTRHGRSDSVDGNATAAFSYAHRAAHKGACEANANGGGLRHSLQVVNGTSPRALRAGGAKRRRENDPLMFDLFMFDYLASSPPTRSFPRLFSVIAESGGAEKAPLFVVSVLTLRRTSEKLSISSPLVLSLLNPTPTCAAAGPA